MTLISMPQWPPFEPAHYPKGMPTELVALLPSLHAACVVVTSAAYELEMFQAFGRNEAFLRKVNGTDVAPAIGLLRTCISDSLILSLAMLFKSDPGAVNLRQLLNTLCRLDYTAFCHHAPRLQSTDRYGAAAGPPDTHAATHQPRPFAWLSPKD